VRRSIEYHIVKDCPGHPDFWEGPYPSLRKAKKDWDKAYKNEVGSQDFIIARVTSEQVHPVRRKK
jgi:hypothetical protein